MKKEKEKVLPEIIYKDIIEANALIGRLSNTKGFPAASMLKMLDLKTELQAEAEKYQKVFAELMQHYDIQESQGVFDWRTHEKVEEISSKVAELFNTKSEIKTLKFLSDENFVQICEGLSLNEMSFLSKILRN